MTVANLSRDAIRALRTYEAGAAQPDAIRLNANEAPYALSAGIPHTLHRYPPLRPARLTSALAGFFSVDAENLLVTRGSSEGIDLLMRTFCTPGTDEILITPPAFDMYRVYAAVQGASVTEVALQAHRDFALDVSALLSTISPDCKLIFLCSPNNPTGTTIPREVLVEIARETATRAIVVVDEAYIDFSAEASCVDIVNDFDNLVVLRTLSKGFALAGARCGCVIAAPDIIALLDLVLPPYAISTPVADQVLAALTVAQTGAARSMTNDVVMERQKLKSALSRCANVDYVWPSDANFLLIRFTNPQEVLERLDNAGILVRTWHDSIELENCVRVSIGTAAQNRLFLDTVRGGTQDA